MRALHLRKTICSCSNLHLTHRGETERAYYNLRKLLGISQQLEVSAFWPFYGVVITINTFIDTLIHFLKQIMFFWVLLPNFFDLVDYWIMYICLWYIVYTVC
jgi:hypothetical protein